MPRGPEYVAPMVAYLCTDQADYINGQVFHVETGRINTYYFGEDYQSLHKGGDGMFTVDELMESVPALLMNGIVPVVPPVKLSEAVKAGGPEEDRVAGGSALRAPRVCFGRLPCNDL